MQSTKTIQSRQVINAVINQVKVNIPGQAVSKTVYRYVMQSASNEEKNKIPS